MNDDVRPFQIAVSDEALDDLRRRLAQSRFPVAPKSDPWRFGAEDSFMREIVEYWRDGYDWRPWEARLNSFGSRMMRVNGLDVHFLFEQGSGPNPLPVIVSHGWPSSIAEFLDLIERLAHPERFGGDVADALTVVVPSLPGFGFSQAPPAPFDDRRRVAEMWTQLMAQLGYERYGAAGGDLGGSVSGWMAYDDPKVVAVHMNMQTLFPNDADIAAEPLSAAEAAWLAEAGRQTHREVGYLVQQGTKPQTLAYGLADSPLGQAAWILEKFKVWTNPQGDAPPPYDRDLMLTNVMLYWLTNSAATASWYYVSMFEGRGFWMEPGGRVTTPAGFCFFPGDTLRARPPIEHSRRTFTNIVRRVEVEHGGHFPGMQCPDVLAENMLAFFRPFH